MKKVLFFLIFSQIFLTACSSKKPENDVFRDDLSEQCSDRRIKNKFLVLWKDGRVTRVEAESKKKFIEDFLTDRISEIEAAEFDHHIEPLPGDPVEAFSNLSVDNWGLDDIKASEAWKRGYRGAGVIVAVIDSGIDTSHQQLANNLAVNKGENGVDSQGRDQRTNGLDDDGNGYVDDWAGYDFVNRHSLVNDSSFHGTHVAGIVAAEHFDDEVTDEYPQGVAPQAKIIPLKFIENGSGSLGDAIEAIDYAVSRGARIINASWGGAGCSDILQDRILSLLDENVLFVSAAGNAGSNIDLFPEYPAALNAPSQITVGSVGSFGHMARHSNYGDERVHIFAPGVDIFSTVPGDQAGHLTGTSMATPFVTGAAAVLLSAAPKTSAAELKQVLMLGAQKDASYRNSSQGRLDLLQSLQDILSPPSMHDLLRTAP